jgi:hypothetical protein
MNSRHVKQNYNVGSSGSAEYTKSTPMPTFCVLFSLLGFGTNMQISQYFCILFDNIKFPICLIFLAMHSKLMGF